MSLIGLGIPLGNVANKIERDDMRIWDMIFWIWKERRDYEAARTADKVNIC